MPEVKNLQFINITNSSILSEFAYDAKFTWLFVAFKNGSKYKYSEVPVEIFNNITELHITGGSVGSYYTKNIKGKFTCVKLGQIAQ